MTHEEAESSIWPFLVGLASLIAVLGFTTALAWHLHFMGLLIGGMGVVGIGVALFGWLSEVHGDAPTAGLSRVAVIVFIFSEAALFGGLFASYFYILVPAPAWPPATTPAHVPPLGLPLFLSLFLLLSSVTFHMAEAQLERGNTRAFKVSLLWTFSLGSIFLYGQMTEWSGLLQEGFSVSTDVYSTFFYSITGFHGSHVIVGLILQIFILILHARGKIRSGRQPGSGREPIVRACGYYWHFVDGIWLVVLSLVYLLPHLTR